MFAVAFSIIFSSMCIESKAASDIYYIDCSQPSTAPGQGYLALAIRDSDGSQYLKVYQWSINSVETSGDSTQYEQNAMKIDLTPTSFKIQPQMEGWRNTVLVVSYDGKTQQSVVEWSTSNDSELNTGLARDFGSSGKRIIGFQLGGDYNIAHSSLGYTSSIRIGWGTTSIIVDAINGINSSNKVIQDSLNKQLDEQKSRQKNRKNRQKHKRVFYKVLKTSLGLFSII